jgi:fermentation-respiration switch protein FrsA (DUF1100 family)
MNIKFRSLIRFVAAIVLTISSLVPTYAQECTPDGNWMAIISRRKVHMRIGLHIEATANGYKGYMISPDQTTDQFGLDEVTWAGDSLKASCKKAGLKIAARMNGSCDSLDGLWIQTVTLNMSFFKVDQLPSMSRPQEPFPPYPYNTDEVTFKNEKEDIVLSGTLSYPKGEGPFPAVVLVTGSGPQNRDEELLGHKPFLLIADYLTREGIAVLRYDDRGTGKSGGVFATANSFQFADDAQAAVNYLMSCPHIDAKHVGVLGHSEGGMIAPIVASRDKKVAFIILLAGPGTTGKQILISQSELIGRADSVPEAEIQDNLRIAKLTYEIIEKEKDPMKMAEQIRAMVKKETEGMTPEQLEEAGLTSFGVTSMIMTLTSNWFTTFVKFDPVPWIKKVRCPVLALNGSMDLQVPAKENLAGVEAALKAGKCKDYACREFDGLNHLFQHCTTGSPSEYISITETMSPEVLRTIADWIKVKSAEK